jgi:hypothetical protein
MLGVADQDSLNMYYSDLFGLKATGEDQSSRWLGEIRDLLRAIAILNA